MNFLNLVLAAASITSTSPALLQSPSEAASPRLAVRDVGALLRPIREHYDLPGMVAAVVQGKEVVASGADGVRKRGEPDKITVQDKMHLGSCTKSMTATVCALLVEEGKLSWSTTIASTFPELATKMDPGWRDVSLELLLTHHGCAPANLDAGDLWSKLWAATGAPKEQRMMLVRGVLERPPEVKPGSKYIYSNAGFAIAGVMAERAAGMPYEELMKKRLFVPLHMDSAGFGAPGTSGKLDQPLGHRADGSPVDVGPSADNPVAITPAGRVHCSIGDWAKYVALHVGGEAAKDDGTKPMLKPETFRKLHAPFAGDDSKYAMGWSATEREWGGRVLTHNGSNTMWFCVTWLSPEKDFAVLVATNQGGDKAAKACDEASGALIQEYLRASKDTKAK